MYLLPNLGLEINSAMKKILILAANPTNTNQLRLDEEVREIEKSHKQATNREEVEIISKWAVRVDDLRRELLYHKPNVVHFCGHGEGDDGLVLEDKNGQMQLVSNESLGDLFKLFKNDLDCVVLNACYSQVQAEAIHQHINCVIGMNRVIGDKAAIEFTTGFYDGLFNGRNYQDSFEFGKNAIDLASIPESQTPQIKIKDSSQRLLDQNFIDSKLKKEAEKAWQTQIHDGTAYIAETININPQADKPIESVKNLPPGTNKFVGRSLELLEIHSLLYEQQNIVAISAIAGMGGIGKTELAIKYAHQHENDYPGGICWLNARDGNLATEILQFAQSYLKLKVPQKDYQGNLLNIEQQVAWCWQNWQPSQGLVLVIFDDVSNKENWSAYLPNNSRFGVLITTRLQSFDIDIKKIALNVFSPDEALEIFINMVGSRKVNRELEMARKICGWVGYLPLGVELAGRYIANKPPHLTLAKTLAQLKQQQPQQEGENTLIQTQRSVKTAFELSYLELDEQTQKIAAILSLFAEKIFVWEWVESIANSLNWDGDNTDIALEQLYQRHLVSSSEESDIYYYQIHPLIHKFLQENLEEFARVNEFKQAFISVFIEIAQSIPYSPTLEFINSVKKAIPHLTEIAENLTDVVSDENLFWAFTGLTRFYEGQGLYALAEPWCQRCVSAVKLRLGENHPLYVSSLNNLAALYSCQGRYEQAQPLSIQALELRKQLLGENHSDYAFILSNLATIYHYQGKYEQAQPLYIQALELYKQLFRENHPDYAISLDNLAALYQCQGRYKQAQPLLIQALELRKQLLGENHPDYAISLNNLAALYYSQRKYKQAQPLYIQALELRKQLLGENHPDYVDSLNNLALLYYFQRKYEQAESLCIRALEIRERVLGANHPKTVTSRKNLKILRADPIYFLGGLKRWLFG